MGLLDTLIVTSCVGLSGASQDACNKALTAGAKQSGIEATANNTEQKITKAADKDAKELLGTGTVNVVAGTAFLVKSVASKSAVLNLPNLGICNTMTININQQQSLLNLKWMY